MPQPEHILNLLKKASAGLASEQELKELTEYLRLDESGETTEIIGQYLNTNSENSSYKTQINDWKIFAQKITQTDKRQAEAPIRSIKRNLTWVRYAAAIIIIIGITAYFWSMQSGNGRNNTESEVLADASHIMPGTDRAILTLADGRTITLDSTGNGQIARQSGATIIKNEDQIVYQSAAGNNTTIAINTMSTPRGGQYKLVLPDGTKVWLNAASSISYPTAFIKNTREVKVKGEAYFEVTKNAAKPFIVDVESRMKVEVLGTHFNINSYENEASIRTTLLEGSVRIIRAGPTTGVNDQQSSAVILKPGEQARLASDQPQIKVIGQVDLDQTTAWKNGVFNFNGLDVQGVLRQIERWYDVDIKYETTPAAVVFKGEMYRNVNLSDVLEKLQEMSGVKFRMDGKKLIVL